MDDYSSVTIGTLAELACHLWQILAGDYDGPHNCSLVDKRWRNFIHWMRAASV
jgi:hypothetical protein